MSNKINVDELKAMIANEVKSIGLNDVLDSEAIEKVKNKIINIYNHNKAKNSVPDIIPESLAGASPNSTLPTDENSQLPTSTDVTGDLDNVHLPKDFTQTPGQNSDAGTTGNIPEYKPELPSFIDKIEPAKIIVFSQNELSEGGENLTKKPLRTFEDPDIKRSMHEFWLDNGQKKAEVYMAKLEKIGELEYDYANGTTKFVEKRFDPDFEAQAKYKENPYMADNAGPATPGALNINGQSNIVAQIAGSVDIEKVVTDIVMNILRNQLSTNQTRAVNADEFNSITNKIAENFNIKMIDLINDYNKVDVPNTLKEALDKNDKSKIINENDEVKEWNIDGISYFTPVKTISNRKCYTK